MSYRQSLGTTVIHLLDVAGAEDTLARVDRHEEVSGDHRDDGHELHHNVKSKARGILARVYVLQFVCVRTHTDMDTDHISTSHNVESRARGILERITDGVAHNSPSVRC